MTILTDREAIKAYYFFFLATSGLNTSSGTWQNNSIHSNFRGILKFLHLQPVYLVFSFYRNHLPIS